MKRKLFFLLTVLLPAMTWAAVGDEFAADGLKYKVTSESPKTVELTRFDGARPTGALTVPATVNGYAVTSIGTYAFKGCDGITSVEIPGSVTSIGTYAFCYCYGLTSVTIGNGVTSIGDYAFFGCKDLKSLTIPASMRSIGVAAFVACYDLKSVMLTAGVTSIGEQAFAKCNSLVSVNIPESLTSLHPMAFDECTNLESITVAQGNEHYKSVDGVLFSKDMTTLIKYPFAKKQTNYAIPVGVTKIDTMAFHSCSGLQAVTLPASVTTISRYAFSVCKGMESFTVDAGNKYYKSVDGVLFDKGMTTLILYPENKKSTSYVIPSGVQTISSTAFVRCPGLTSVTIPVSVTSIDNMAFASCADLTTVSIAKGSKLKTVGRDPFFRCEKLSPIEYPAGVDVVR
jgi:hypothetical protein